MVVRRPSPSPAVRTFLSLPTLITEWNKMHSELEHTTQEKILMMIMIMMVVVMMVMAVMG